MSCCGFSRATNIAYLRKSVSIWDEWADEYGDRRPGLRCAVAILAGGTVRHIDQIANLIEGRRPIQIALTYRLGLEPADDMALPPCHCLFQFYVSEGKLSCQLYQRSADIFLGVPFNIASYALLTMMVAQVTGLKPGDFVHTLGDTHIYKNHFEQARLQLTRTPKALPTMRINPQVKDIFSFKYEDFELVGYEADSSIKAPIAV